MAPALAAAFAGAAPHGYLRQVVFITDGGIANEDGLFEQIRSQLGEARLFTVGIGAAPNAFFMRKAAELGRGDFTFIGSEGEVGAKMHALLAKLAAPALTDIEIEWPATSKRGRHACLTSTRRARDRERAPARARRQGHRARQPRRTAMECDRRARRAAPGRGRVAPCGRGARSKRSWMRSATAMRMRSARSSRSHCDIGS
jgi:hypothetical protein